MVPAQHTDCWRDKKASLVLAVNAADRNTYLPARQDVPTGVIEHAYFLLGNESPLCRKPGEILWLQSSQDLEGDFNIVAMLNGHIAF